MSWHCLVMEKEAALEVEEIRRANGGGQGKEANNHLCPTSLLRTITMTQFKCLSVQTDGDGCKLHFDGEIACYWCRVVLSVVRDLLFLLRQPCHDLRKLCEFFLNVAGYLVFD